MRLWLDRHIHLRRSCDAPRLSSVIDPFDRMAIGQALCEGLTLVTRGDTLSRHQVDLLRTPTLTRPPTPR